MVSHKDEQQEAHGQARVLELRRDRLSSMQCGLGLYRGAAGFLRGLLFGCEASAGPNKPWHILNFLPLPQGQERFLLGVRPSGCIRIPGPRWSFRWWSISGSGCHGAFRYAKESNRLGLPSIDVTMPVFHPALPGPQLGIAESLRMGCAQSRHQVLGNRVRVSLITTLPSHSGTWPVHRSQHSLWSARASATSSRQSVHPVTSSGFSVRASSISR